MTIDQLGLVFEASERASSVEHASSVAHAGAAIKQLLKPLLKDGKLPVSAFSRRAPYFVGQKVDEEDDNDDADDESEDGDARRDRLRRSSRAGAGSGASAAASSSAEKAPAKGGAETASAKRGGSASKRGARSPVKGCPATSPGGERKQPRSDATLFRSVSLQANACLLSQHAARAELLQ